MIKTVLQKFVLVLKARALVQREKNKTKQNKKKEGLKGNVNHFSFKTFEKFGGSIIANPEIIINKYRYLPLP